MRPFDDLFFRIGTDAQRNEITGTPTHRLHHRAKSKLDSLRRMDALQCDSDILVWQKELMLIIIVILRGWGEH